MTFLSPQSKQSYFEEKQNNTDKTKLMMRKADWLTADQTAVINEIMQLQSLNN